MKETITDLASSRKVWVMFAAVVGAVALNLRHEITGAQALDFLKWIVGAWMAAHAYQESNKPADPPAAT